MSERPAVPLKGKHAMTNDTIALPAELFDFVAIRREAFREAICLARTGGPDANALALMAIIDRVDTFLRGSPMEHVACAQVAASRGLGMTAQRCLHWANERTKATQVGREHIIGQVWQTYLGSVRQKG